MDKSGIARYSDGALRVMSLGVPLIALLLATCSKDPFGWFSGFTDETVPGVSVALIAEPTAVNRGDTIYFRALATNTTSEPIQIGIQCGPSMDVALIGEDGQTRSALADIVGPNGAFTCELGPHHYVEANSTWEQILKWSAVARGEYRAVAGLRRSEGLGNRSSPVRVIVR